MNLLRTAVIISVFTIGIANTVSAAPPANNFQRIDSARSQRTPVIHLQKIDNTVLGELNFIDGNMGVIYQAMFSLLQEGYETRKIEGEAIKLAGEQKLRNALAAVGAKKQEIEQKVQAAKDEWATAVAIAMASCTAVVCGVTNTGNSINALYDMPNDQRLHNFTSNSDILKKNLTALSSSLNDLRNLLRSGKFEKLPRENLEKLKSNFNNGFQNFRAIKNSTSERVKKRKGQ